MNIEKKYKWAIAGLIVMVVLNAVTLVTIWVNQPNQNGITTDRSDERGRAAVHQFMKKELGLDSGQAESMAEKRRSHMREMRDLQRELAQLRQSYFDDMMKTDSDDYSMNDSLRGLISDKYLEIEDAMAEHITDMKTVLTPDQQEAYRELVNESIFRERHHRQMRGNRNR